MQVVDLPADIFEEAVLVLQRIEGTDTGIMALSERDSETPGGVTAEVLNMVALETAQLTIPPPEVGNSSHCYFASSILEVCSHLQIAI